MFQFWLNSNQIEAAGENLRSADQSTKLYMKARIVGREDINRKIGGHARFIVRKTPIKGNLPAGSVEWKARRLQGDVLSSHGKLCGALPVGSDPGKNDA